ncbi:hypothetical protein HRR83_001535 [Exophiala dermatitidis]|uniref:Uncharacterized protein n=2 Tax=Exophiala dermatitidis TaxID=5970 RepID=H6C647_EXODN|nr:uncharacterized protein HMPREF1120_07190 [Exophiala dermatitidis NIH/UT8656]KAJ4526343.1 hypothetical protein HRR74_001539 [Exophiala dermatitidis]EHY59193.1 hypothetical protein HMPREF1120_07190 [Exophiala dermatitidis NIH/UT8656]KAJ4526714.1 hypothetical protein HRR73_001508 [Exophiala dermatitidis]KAJ4532418.1 hypothetical protein HRR76_007411 [Exophiala dermatitidis]KAJ4547075.1 hypothetical protein HRR77_004608 [Exophiala dermatitidis]
MKHLTILLFGNLACASIVLKLSDSDAAAVGSLTSSISNVQHTFYGYPDNDPPGPATAYNCGGRNFVAGGTGTHDNPLTMATAPGKLNQCETIYVPYLKKYVRFEDTCAQCTDDWNGGSGKRHIDIWTGSSTINGGQKQIDCEDALTPDQPKTIVRNPAANLEVDGKFELIKRASPEEITYALHPHLQLCGLTVSRRRSEKFL